MTSGILKPGQLWTLAEALKFRPIPKSSKCFSLHHLLDYIHVCPICSWSWGCYRTLELPGWVWKTGRHSVIQSLGIIDRSWLWWGHLISFIFLASKWSLAFLSGILEVRVLRAALCSGWRNGGSVSSIARVSCCWGTWVVTGLLLLVLWELQMCMKGLWTDSSCVNIQQVSDVLTTTN